MSWMQYELKLIILLFTVVWNLRVPGIAMNKAFEEAPGGEAVRCGCILA